MSEETAAASSAPIATETSAPPTLAQKLTAEVIGTFILVLFGCGAAVTVGQVAGNDGNGAAFVGTVGLAFGLAIVVTVYAFGRVSGGHFNPAVSVGAAVSGRIAWVEAGFYIVAQIVGAIIGALVLWIGTKGIDGFSSTKSGLGNDGFGSDYNGYAWWAALVVEIVLTAVFVFIILATTDIRNEHPNLAPLAIGLTLAAIHFVAIPLDGTSVNPARSIGPALFSGSDAIKDLWVFIIAPVVGAAISGITYPLLFGRAEEPVPGSGWSFPARTPAAVGWGTAAPDQFQQQWNQQPGAESVSWGQPAAGQPAADQAAAQPGVGQPTAQPTAHAAEQTQATGEQSWQQPVAPAAEGELPVYEQDGWRWDYAKQQWVPIDQAGGPQQG